MPNWTKRILLDSVMRHFWVRVLASYADCGGENSSLGVNPGGLRLASPIRPPATTAPESQAPRPSRRPSRG
jgi:hypothetical protein